MGRPARRSVELGATCLLGGDVSSLRGPRCCGRNTTSRADADLGLWGQRVELLLRERAVGELVGRGFAFVLAIVERERLGVELVACDDALGQPAIDKKSG